MVHSSTKSKGWLWAHQWQLAMPIYLCQNSNVYLHDYEQRYKCKPALWLRFKDDILLVWRGDEASLKSFLKYCNEYNMSRDMSPNIKFSYSYSLSTVSFLDVKVTMKKMAPLQHHSSLNHQQHFNI